MQRDGSGNGEEQNENEKPKNKNSEMLIITYIFFKKNCSHLKRKQYQRIEREFQKEKGRKKKENRKEIRSELCEWKREEGRRRKHVEENILVFKHAKQQQLYGQIKTSKQVNITLYK